MQTTIVLNKKNFEEQMQLIRKKMNLLGELKIKLEERRKNHDNEITASFDVSTAGGKKQCLDYFKSL